MVQTDISQLSAETAEWRQILRNYRNDLTESKKLLQDTCRQDLSKEHLPDVEHFNNQFHIQLINIHDLKQQIKLHNRKVEFEKSKGDQISEDVFAEHERLLDEFLTLEHTLQELRSEYKNFISVVSC